MINNKLVKITIDASNLAKTIINVMIRHYGLPNSIIMDQGYLITSEFWFLVCYFSKIKQSFFMAIYF